MFLSPRRAGDRTTATSLTASILPVVFSFVFSTGKTDRGENLLPSFFFVYLLRYARTNVPTAQPSHPESAASGYRDTSRKRWPGQKVPALLLSWKIDQKRSNEPLALFFAICSTPLRSPRSLFLPRFPSFLFIPIPMMCLPRYRQCRNEWVEAEFRGGPQTMSLPPEILDDIIGHGGSSWWIKESSMVWKRNSSPSLFPYALYISSSCTFPFYGQKGQGEGDKTIRLSQENMDPFLCSPMLLPLLNFRPTFLHDFSRNICFSRYRTGKRNGFLFSISAIRRRIN